MTDNLVKRLRNVELGERLSLILDTTTEAADCIENLSEKLRLCVKAIEAQDALKTRIQELETLVEVLLPPRRWDITDRVKKKSGSEWHGRIVGFYSTEITSVGYCVESEFERNSVQIYPESALEDWHD